MQNTRSLGSTLDRMMTLNRAIDQAFTGGWLNEARVWAPAVDVVEKKDAYVIYAELPGVHESQTELVFEQNVLTIRGVKQPSIDLNQAGDLRVFAAGRATGTFERSIRLPEFIDGTSIVAESARGVLTVTVPKAKAAQARRIDINTGVNSAN
jgi:HSP20 family protein